MMTLAEQLREAGMAFADLTRLSQGVLSEGKLKKHSQGITILSPEDRALANRIIAEYRMMKEKVRFVVFEAVGNKQA